MYTRIISTIGLIHPLIFVFCTTPFCYYHIPSYHRQKNASPEYISQTKPLSLPPTTSILDSAVNIYDDSQSFLNPRKIHSVTSTGANSEIYNQIKLGSDSLQCPIKYKFNETSQKIPPPGKYYLCLKNNGRSAWSSQCDKSRALSEVVQTMLSIEPFE